MTKPKSSLLAVPHIIQDTMWLCNHFYQNSPSLKSRIIPVFLKYVVDIFILPDNNLSKDANPASSAVIREIVTLPVTMLNVIFGVQYTISEPYVVDFTHLAGNSLRLVCKAKFQMVSNMTEYDSILFSRGSNIVCDVFGIVGLESSKLSQKDGKVTSLPYPIIQKFLVPTSEFLEEKFTKQYVIQSLQTAAFKSLVIDQTGEVIKLISNSNPIIYIHNLLEKKKDDLLVNFLNISPSIIDQDHANNIHNQMEIILNETNYTNKGYLINTMLGIYKVSVKALPDLLIIGPIMLSSAKDAIEYFFFLTPLSITNIKTYISGGEEYILSDGRTTNTDISNTLISTGLSTLGFLYKKEIFSSMINISSELTALGVIMLSDNVYDSFKETSLAFKVACAAGAFVYSSFKEDIYSYVIGENLENSQLL